MQPHGRSAPGGRFGDDVEVLSGLREGEQVVVPRSIEPATHSSRPAVTSQEAAMTEHSGIPQGRNTTSRTGS